MAHPTITTDQVELQRLDGPLFALRVGLSVIHLTQRAIDDLTALVDPNRYPDGRVGQTVHIDQDYLATSDPRTAAILVAHIGTYDGIGKPAADGVASEPYCRPTKRHKPKASSLCLALVADGATYVTTMSRPQAAALILWATLGMSDAS